MKYIMYTLLAASLSITACRKSQTATPVSPASGEVLNDCRAKTMNGHNKKSATGLELDYDLVIKEVANGKYSAKLKIHGLTLDGKKIAEYKPDGYSSLVIALNNTKEKEEVPLDVLLKSTENKGDTYIFPEFQYKGDLAYEMLDVSISMAINGATVSITDIIKVNLAGFVITVDKNDRNVGNGTCTFEFTNTGSEPRVSFTTFAILFANVKGEGKCSVSDDGSFFVLPSGHTEIQDPKIAKVRLEKQSDGTIGYLTVTVKGDPAHNVTALTYQPTSVSANDPKDPKAMIVYPVMKFELTHFNQKNGVARFKSTQTWQAVYGKEKVPPVYDDAGMHMESPMGK